MIEFLYFFLAVFLALYIPGNIMLRNLKLNFISSVTFSIGLGIVLWAFQGLFFGFMGFREGTYVYIFIFLVIWIRLCLIENKISMPRLKVERSDIPTALLLVIGIFIQLLFTFLNGIQINGGMYFCCGIPDSLYHIGLTNSLVNNFPPFEPAMSGELVKNYHYLANLIQADLIRVFNLPLIFTQYQYLPLLVSSLIAFSILSISKILKLGNVFSFFALLFLFFWGDITYILAFIKGQGLNFHMPFLYDSTALWFSPPRAFGAAITLIGIGLFCIWLKKYSLQLTILIALIFGSLLGIKVYFGVFIFFGLAALTLFYIYKRDFQRILLPFLALFFGLLIYLPLSSEASGLQFVGPWRVQNFAALEGLGLSHLELERQVYIAHNNILRQIQLNLMYFIYYFIFVFGTLNIAFLQTRKSLSLFPKELHVVLISGTISSLIIGFFFFQKISGANTSQFIITAEIIGALYAGLTCMFLFKRLGKLRYIFILLLIIFTLPRVANQVRVQAQSINSRNQVFLEKSEVEALDFLKNNSQKDALIFTDNNKLKIEKTCYYVGFLTNRKMFLCDAEGILADHGVNINTRNSAYKEIIKNYNSQKAIDLLIANKIDYIYTTSHFKTKDTGDLKTVFVNDKIKIIRVKH